MSKFISVIFFTSVFITVNGQSHYKNLKPCAVPESRDSALCGSFLVYENRITKQGRKIGLNIIVIPALNKNSNQPPIFFFDGGPGIGTTKNASWFAEKNNPYRQNNDIVLVDIRGTGGSNPLHCYELQYHKGLAEQFDEHNPSREMYPVEEVKSCYDSLSKKADLTQYTTTNIVHDMEEVRQWLDYKKIHLFGLSYGTRLAQEYMRRFPSSIETVVLQSATSAGNRMPLYHAKFAQATLEKLFTDCTVDSLCRTAYPQLRKEFNALMSSGKKQHFKTIYTFSDDTRKQLSIPWSIFHTKLRTLMYEPSGLRQIPFIIHEAYKGNWKPFLSLYSEKGNYSDFFADGLYLSITCSEDVPFIKRKEARSLTRKTFMGNYRIQQQQNACVSWTRGNIPNDLFHPVRSEIPTLILAGAWDPITPVSMARVIAQHLSKSQLVIIPTMSHGFDGLSNGECFDKIVMEFINGSGNSKVNMDCVSAMQPPSYKIK